jgi:hypothetical protein
LLLVAFSVPALPSLPRLPGYVSGFDADAASATARTIAQRFPDRRPGTRGAVRATDYVQQQLEASGYHVTRDTFRADVAGLGRRTLVNLVAEAPGRSRDTILVIAHRDDSGAGGGLDDNASGTGALLELARGYGARAAAARTPLHTIVFLSTDGGAYGGIGARRFAEQVLGHRVILGAVALDAIGGRGPVRIVTSSDSPSSPDPTLVGTARDALAATSSRLETTQASASHQLLDLAFPFSLYEQGAFTARGTPAIALTTAGDRPPDTPTGGPPLDEAGLRGVGTAVGRLVATLDEAGPTATTTRTYVLVGARRIKGWAIQLLLLAAVLPAFVVIVDLFARCRRREISLAPALRALSLRCAYWIGALLLFELLNAGGAFPHGTARPVSLETSAAQDWPVATLVLFGLVLAGGWLVVRQRLLPHGTLAIEEDVAGHTAALLGLLVVTLLVIALNRYSLVLVLPSLHAWIWLPQLHGRPRWMRIAVFFAGLAGPLWLLHAFSTRLGLGFDTPWYLMELAVVHLVSFPFLLVGVCWVAVAAQLVALTTGRYAPVPARRRGSPPTALRRSVGRLAHGGRSASPRAGVRSAASRDG